MTEEEKIMEREVTLDSFGKVKLRGRQASKSNCGWSVHLRLGPAGSRLHGPKSRRKSKDRVTQGKRSKPEAAFVKVIMMIMLCWWAI
jgi:hypothetical protein